MLKTNTRTRLAAVLIVLSAVTTSAQALIINVNPGATLATNPDALAAFNQAANQWSSRIADPITVSIGADLAPLGTGIIGLAAAVTLQAGYDSIRNAMVADSASEADDGVVASLPTAAQFSAFLPTGFHLSGGLSATKANLKALGFAGLDTAFGATDATIQFSSNFAFDFDASDGVAAGLIDFETVAAHEIGHALGFVSIVDSIEFLIGNGQTAGIAPRTLDLFRFGSGANPSNLADFTTTARNLVPGDAAIFDDLMSELAFSTGTSSGDGRQAGHWKDNDLSGTLIGTMDPTLASGTFVPVGLNDLRALDLIGYDIRTAPIPPAFYLFGSGLLGLVVVARKKAV
jgi:hypothetical protein